MICAGVAAVFFIAFSFYGFFGRNKGIFQVEDRRSENLKGLIPMGRLRRKTPNPITTIRSGGRRVCPTGYPHGVGFIFASVLATACVALIGRSEVRRCQSSSLARPAATFQPTPTLRICQSFYSLAALCANQSRPNVGSPGKAQWRVSLNLQHLLILLDQVRFGSSRQGLHETRLDLLVGGSVRNHVVSFDSRIYHLGNRHIK